jgi:hypothetical protein
MYVEKKIDFVVVELEIKVCGVLHVQVKHVLEISRWSKGKGKVIVGM